MKNIAIRFLQALILLVALSWISAAHAQPASLQILGSRLVRDGDFYAARSADQGVWLPRRDVGGVWSVYLKNGSDAPLEIKGFSINGVKADDLPNEKLGNLIADSRWWMAWPNPVAPGATTTLRVRLNDLKALGDAPKLEVTTDKATQNFEIKTAAPNLVMPFIGFNDKLDGAVLYVSNRGAATVRLPKDGGVSLDGQTIAATSPQSEIKAGETVPLALKFAAPLAVGQSVILGVNAENGAQAWGSLRAFPARFGVTVWGFGGDLDKADAARHNIDTDIPGFQNFQDEPIGNRVPPMKVRDRILDSWAKNPTRPVMTQFTGYEENLVYGDMADVQMTHHGNVEQDLSLFSVGPKPIWYLPQNAWGRKEGVGKNENWYPLEDLRREAFEGIAHGAKNIQWFSYYNLWNQGYGRGGGFDAARTHPDFTMPGAIANPILWDRVGRVSGDLQTLAPFLSVSSPIGHAVNDAGIEVSTILSGTNKAIVALVDHRTPSAFYKQSAPEFAQQVLYNQKIRVILPAFVVAPQAFTVDSFAGVTPVPLTKLPSGETELTVSQLDGAALIMLGTEADGATLRAAWNARHAKTADFAENARTSALRAAWLQPAGQWNAPQSRWRVRLDAKNNGAAPLAAFDAKLDLPRERHFDAASWRVLETANGKTQPVPFARREDAVFEDFAGDDIQARATAGFKGATAPRLETPNENGRQSLRLFSRKEDKQFWYGLKITAPNGWKDAMIPADFTEIIVEANTEDYGWRNRLDVIFDFDADGDGKIEGSSHALLLQATLQDDLGGGWKRYVVDVEKAFHEKWPTKTFAGKWNFWIQSVINGGSDAEQSWAIRGLTLTGNDNVRVMPKSPLAPGETRAYQIYFDTRENAGKTAATPPDNSAQGAAVGAAQLVAHAIERAGIAAEIGADKRKISFATDADTPQFWLRHLSKDASVLSQQKLAPTAPRRFELALDRAIDAGDILVAVPVEPGGEGAMFCFDENVQSLTGALASEKSLPAVWTLPQPQLADSIALAPDAKTLAIAAGQSVRVVDDKGVLRWEKSFDGRVFAARFTPDGNSLYVAAELDATTPGNYKNTQILRYDADGKELWRHAVGRTIFDLQTGFVDGGVGYCEWNQTAVRLAPDGKVVWTAKPAGLYANAIRPFADGGALVAGDTSSVRVAPDGKILATLRRQDGAINAIAAAPEGHVLVFADNALNIADANGQVVASPYVGRYPRVTEVSGDAKFIASGSSDGVLQLRGADGALLWEKREPSSYVTALQFLPDGKGLVVTREIFSYAPRMMWRFRDLTEAYDLAGQPLWRQAGSWRDQPSMNLLSLSRDGKFAAIATARDVRLVDVAAVAGEVRLDAPRAPLAPSNAKIESAETPEKLVALFARSLENEDIGQMAELHHAQYKGIGGDRAGALDLYRQFFDYGIFAGVRTEEIKVTPDAANPNAATLEWTMAFPAWGRIVTRIEKVNSAWVIRERRQ